MLFMMVMYDQYRITVVDDGLPMKEKKTVISKWSSMNEPKIIIQAVLNIKSFLFWLLFISSRTRPLAMRETSSLASAARLLAAFRAEHVVLLQQWLDLFQLLIQLESIFCAI